MSETGRPRICQQRSRSRMLLAVKAILAAALALGHAAPAAAEPCRDPVPLLHSHNDYLRGRPVHEALEQRVDSLEADVYPVGGELWVAHARQDLRPGRTLESMYLRPLRELARANGGRVLPHDRSLVLLVDVKADPGPAYQSLKTLLAGYQELLTRYEGGEPKPGAITVLVSGERPRALIESDPQRLAAIDGDYSDLDSTAPVSLVPWVSLGWTDLLRRRGLDAEDREKVGGELAALSAKAAKRGRKLRIWGAPDAPWSWRMQCAAGIEILNTDQPARARRFVDTGKELWF